MPEAVVHCLGVIAPLALQCFLIGSKNSLKYIDKSYLPNYILCMMSSYSFSVKGLPPKKDGAQSMWGKPLEAKRLVALRKSALESLKGDPPLASNIKLTLKIHLPANNRMIGDLDNFIIGICDGLMATPYGGKLDPIWEDPDLVCIHPSKPIAVMDDCEMVSIQAEKIIDNNDQPWYEICLGGER